MQGAAQRMPLEFEGVLSSLTTGFPVFAGHLLLTLTIWLAAFALHEAFVHRHIAAVVGSGNVAQSLLSGCVLVSLAIPLSVCLAGSLSAIDILVWAVPLTLTQLMVHKVFDLIFHMTSDPKLYNQVSLAILVGMTRISIGIILAGAIAD
jgi:uncharacterized membrane protein YjfL (UPF0719 family)